MRALAEWMPSALDDSSAGCDPSPILPGKGDTTLLRACTLICLFCAAQKVYCAK